MVSINGLVYTRILVAKNLSAVESHVMTPCAFSI